MDTERKQRLNAAMTALIGIKHAEVSRLSGYMISPETVSNIRRQKVKRIPLTTIIALETAVVTLARRAA